MGRKTDLSGLDMRKFKRVQTRTAMEKMWRRNGT